MSEKRSSIALFLIGTFAMTQIRFIGSIGISELAMSVMAPFLFARDARELRRDGFFPVIFLVGLTCFSCMISSYFNDTPMEWAVRGIAAPYVILSSIIVIHHYIRINLNGLKWLLLGLAFSSIINIFVFHGATEAYIAAMRGDGGVESIVSGPLFWINRISNFATLPLRGWFLQTPYLISLITPFILAIYSLFFSVSGRAAALICFFSFIILLVGGKTVRKMKRLQRNFFFLLMVMALSAIGMKAIYKELAQSGALGEKAQQKYEAQTKSGSDILSLIIAGRVDCFVGLMACLDKPLIGHGPWAIDTEHYYERFLHDYGAAEDYEKYYEEKIMMAKMGVGERITLIPGHSHFISGWLWYGLPGLLMWVYVFVVGITVVRKYIASVPQWFGYFAVAIPGMLWHFVFSPPGSRVQDACMIVCFLMARAVGQGRIGLTAEMHKEIYEVEK